MERYKNNSCPKLLLERYNIKLFLVFKSPFPALTTFPKLHLPVSYSARHRMKSRRDFDCNQKLAVRIDVNTERDT
jgi:hypothetical protein